MMRHARVRRATRKSKISERYDGMRAVVMRHRAMADYDKAAEVTETLSLAIVSALEIGVPIDKWLEAAADHAHDIMENVMGEMH